MVYHLWTKGHAWHWNHRGPYDTEKECYNELKEIDHSGEYYITVEVKKGHR